MIKEANNTLQLAVPNVPLRSASGSSQPSCVVKLNRGQRTIVANISNNCSLTPIVLNL